MKTFKLSHPLLPPLSLSNLKMRTAESRPYLLGKLPETMGAIVANRTLGVTLMGRGRAVKN
jgi:hypothetical protein